MQPVNNTSKDASSCIAGYYFCVIFTGDIHCMLCSIITELSGDIESIHKPVSPFIPNNFNVIFERR
jgi:hypothetical protein